MRSKILIAALCVVGPATILAADSWIAGPFDAQLSGQALQAQREHDFLFSSMQYLASGASANEAERERVMRILTAGGFSSEQLADAVRYIAKPPRSDSGQPDRAALVSRAEVARFILAYGRGTYAPIDRDKIALVNLEDGGWYVQVEGQMYESSDQAMEIYEKARHRLELGEMWDGIEKAINDLDQLIATLPDED